MKGIVAEKSVCNKTKSMLASKSCGFLSGSRSIEFHGPNDELVGNKCSHFSIRAYVAEIREVDRKICWPFVVHDNHNKVEEGADFLPPLCVSQFRWWGCKSCIQKSGIDEATTEKSNPNYFKEKVKTSLPTIEGMLEAIHLSPKSVHLPANESDIHDSNGLDPNEITGGATYGATKIEPNHKGEEISKEENITSIKDKNSLDVVINELERSRSNALLEQEYQMHRVANGEMGIEIPSSIGTGIADFSHMENMRYGGCNLVEIMKEKDHLKVIDYGGHSEVDLGIQNDDAGVATVDPKNELHPTNLNDTANEFSSENSKNLLKRRSDQNSGCTRAINVENCDSPQEVGMLYLNGISHRKRLRKMRLLSDILSNEVLALSEMDQILEVDEESEHIVAAIDYSKSAPDASINNDLDSGLTNHVAHDQGDRKNNVRKKQTKMPDVENGEISLMHWLKDSPQKTNCDCYTSFQKYQKDSKNSSDHKTKVCGNGQRKYGSTQRKHGSAKKKHEETTLDEIPMEIVELMAQYQYERLLGDCEMANESGYPLSETHGSKNSPRMTHLREVLQSEVSSLLPENNPSKQKSQSKNKGGVVFTTEGSTRNLENNLISYPFDSRWKHKSGTLNANQIDQSFISTGFTSKEKSPGKAKFPITGSNKNSISQERKMVASRQSPTYLQSLEAYHMGQEHSNPTSCGELFSRNLKSNTLNFGPNSDEKVLASSCCGCSLSNCSNPSQEPKGKLYTITYRNNSLKSVDPNIGSELQNWKGKVASRTRRRAHRAFTSVFPQKGNDHHVKKLGPSDLCTEDTISAMDLLRIMDQGAYSSTPINVYTSDNQENFINQPHFFNDHHQRSLFGLDGNLIKSRRTFVDPESFGYLKKDNHLGSSCEFVPLIPNIDALGSTSQAGTCSTPCTWKSPTNFMRQYSTEISGLKNKVVSSPNSHEDAKDNHEYLSLIYLKKIPQSSSDSINIFNQSQKKDKSTSIQLGANNQSCEELLNTNQGCKTEVCTLNRNPAEINIAEAESFYMIGFKDQNVRKLYPSSGRSNPDRRKRKKMMKLTAIRGPPRIM